MHKDSLVGGDYDDDDEEDGDDENRESAEKEYKSFLNPLSQLQNTNIWNAEQFWRDKKSTQRKLPRDNKALSFKPSVKTNSSKAES